MRLAAYLLDTAILYPVTVSLSVWLVSRRLESLPRVVQAFMTPGLYYFFLSEWCWGKTLGKHLVGLRVTTNGGSPPSFRQALFRSGIFLGLVALPALLWFTFRLPFSMIGWAGVVGYLLPLLTMRPRNG
jgi:uncharacterized RDD family membrane protein YckC